MVRDAGKAAQAGLNLFAAAIMQPHFFVAASPAALHYVSTMQYWLIKSEPDEISIDDGLAACGQIVPWSGVRNYQARNFMRDRMQTGDAVLFYHSSCKQPGIVGLAEVASTAYPDPTQFDPTSTYFDAKATHENPRWMLVDIRILEKTRAMPLSELRTYPELADMHILRRGNRLSITPVTPGEWRCIIHQLAK